MEHLNKGYESTTIVDHSCDYVRSMKAIKDWSITNLNDPERRLGYFDNPGKAVCILPCNSCLTKKYLKFVEEWAMTYLNLNAEQREDLKLHKHIWVNILKYNNMLTVTCVIFNAARPYHERYTNGIVFYIKIPDDTSTYYVSIFYGDFGRCDYKYEMEVHAGSRDLYENIDIIYNYKKTIQHEILKFMNLEPIEIEEARRKSNMRFV